MKHKKKILITIGLVCLIVSAYIIAAWISPSINVTCIRHSARACTWSIGIYVGEDPFSLGPPEDISNPVLTADDVNDVPAEHLMDPFMVCENGVYYMFFEVFNADTDQGDIGLATSNDGFYWTYRQIVLDEPFHLSYPCVFKWNEEYYMIPESHEESSIRLYKATSFPTEWTFVKDLLSGENYTDSTIFRYDDKWWIFTATGPEAYDTLRLYYADDLMGSWIEHPKSPIVEGNANIARPGGRVIVYDGRIMRYTQDCDPTYGNQVWAFEIDTLTLTAYEEHLLSEDPILKPSGTGWNADRMHHVDPYQTENGWIACVDGLQFLN